MKKYIMLGINTNEKENCCILSCLLPFDKLTPSEVESSDFIHSAIDWNGRGSIEKTCEHLKMKQTGKKILLYEPIVFCGCDYDMGHKYDWKFYVNKICELKEI